MTVIRPQAGQQYKAATCPARMIVYGGGAGGGKTWLQAYNAGVGINAAKYRAVLFRRTYQMITMGGSLLDTCKDVYGPMGAEFVGSPPSFRWPDADARVDLRHLQHAKDAEAHKSAQYARVGFDEGSEFEGGQIDMLSSRLRTMSGVRKQMLITTNPDPDCYLREMVDWYIGADGFPIPERDGVIRYYIRRGDDLVWASDPADLAKYCDDPVNEINSFAFIRSLVTDNKILLAADPEYMAALKGLPEVKRARFLSGNWDAKEGAGDYFQLSWFPAYGTTEFQRFLIGQDTQEWRIVDSVRWWDLAATPVKQNLVSGIQRPADFRARDARTDNPDWSAGVRSDRFSNGKRVLRHAAFYRDTPGAIEAAIERHAHEDGRRTVIGLWQDPGQAGIAQTERLVERLTAAGYRVEVIPAVKSKVEYAREPSMAAWRGEILLEDTGEKWVKQFFNQLEAFPSEDKDVHDDAVDAFSGTELYFATNPIPRYDGYMGPSSLVGDTPRRSILEKPSARRDFDLRGKLQKWL